MRFLAVMTRPFALAALVALSVSNIVAQVGSSRWWSYAMLIDDDLAALFHDGTGSTADWEWPGASGLEKGIVNLPFDKAGVFLRVSNSAVLAAGVDTASATSTLVELQFNPTSGGVVITALNHPLGSMDIVDLHYDKVAQRLYAVDYHERNVLYSNYQPGTAPGGWTVIADAGNCALLESSRMFLGLAAPTMGSPGVDLLCYHSFGHRQLSIVESATGWQILERAFASPGALWRTEVHPRVSSNSRTFQVFVAGGSGPVRIVDAVTGVTVHQATKASLVGELLDVPLDSLVYGREYYLESAAGQSVGRSTSFRVAMDWRRATTHPSVLVGPVNTPWDFRAAGGESLTWSLFWKGLTAPPSGSCLLTVLVGGWDYYVNPTVPALPGVDVLGVQFGSMDLLARSWSAGPAISAAYLLAVNNPVFLGARVAFQGVAYLPTGEVLASDVRGVVMQ